MCQKISLPTTMRRSRFILSTGLLPLMLVLVLPARAQTSVPPTLPAGAASAVQAVRLAGSIDVDGRLDDAAWAAAPAIEGFRQNRPREGAPASQRTVVRVLYDDAALYVGARMYDTAPDSIISRLGRRDDNHLNADDFVVFLDPYHDRRSGFYFAVNVAGTLYDGTMFNDSNMDDSWDGVWVGKAARDAEGWTAEFRIPYSQLRFAKAEVQTWGVNFQRNLARRNEESRLRYVPSSENGFVSHFADLTGIERIRPPRGFEAVPYVTSRAAFTDGGAGNPFNDGSRYRVDAGADFKLGLSSNLTLSATVNPDFGQVEVDPAVVNLSGFETFFPERRPFFVEGSNVFNGFGNGGSGRNFGFNWVNNNFFYSRRVGRAPQGSLPPSAFSDRPDAARILGAGKVTGRVGQNNVGFMSALTGRGIARIAQADGTQGRVEVEPLTHYGVARALREFGGGQQGLGFMGTATNRFFDDDRLRDQINGQAYVGGVDGWVRLFDNRYVLKGFVAASHVAGTAARIATLQRSSTHYLQRPDRERFRFDPARTSLTGMMGRVMFDKLRGDVTLNAALGFVTPTYDINDAGFLGRTDLINPHFFIGKNYPRPHGIFQRRWMGTAVSGSWDFDGNRTGTLFWARSENTFRNFYTLGGNLFYNPPSTSNSLTRGGPLARNMGGFGVFVNASTDSRKRWQAFVDGGGNWGAWGTMWNGNVSLSYQPLPTLNVSLSPGVFHNLSKAQFVRQQLDATAGLDAPIGASVPKARYVVAEIDQWEIASSVRLNWTFSPTMSLQLFAQPLLSTGDYHRFGELARTRAYEFHRYGENGYGTVTEANNRVTVDPDGSGAAPSFSFNNPDFRFISLRGNAVFRWEYRPGSTLFLVWTQQADDFEQTGTFAVGRPVGRLFDERPDNVFAVKLTYWLGR
jgi:hypothetical protein